MQRLTYGAVKEAAAKKAGMCSTDSRVLTLVNDSVERLMSRGKWVGTVQRYQMLATSGLITWPRQILTIESFAMNDRPGVIRNGWYEFLSTGPHLLNSDDCPGTMLIDRGMACTVADITVGVTNRKVRAYCDLAADAGEEIWIEGYDENGNWIQTQEGAEWVSGEKLTLAVSPGTTSTKFFTAVTGIRKAVTAGPVRLYEYNNTTAANVKLLGQYEPGEERPVYRRSLVPGLDEDEDNFVTVTARLQFIPAAVDADWLMLGNKAAITLGVQAILKEEKDLLPEAEMYWGKAITELERELRSYQGDGAVVAPRIQDPMIFGGGGVENLI